MGCLCMGANLYGRHFRSFFQIDINIGNILYTAKLRINSSTVLWPSIPAPRYGKEN